jgi:hypothetical protein
MIWVAWLFIGAVAILSTAATLLTNDDAMAILLGIAGFGSWGLVAYGSFDVAMLSNGSEFTYTMPAVAIFCAGISLIPLYIALTGPIDLVTRAKDPTLDEV